MDNNQPKSVKSLISEEIAQTVKSLISEEIAHATMSYFEQVFIFCMLIEKNVLKWFLLIACKEHILVRSANLISRNHPKLCF